MARLSKLEQQTVVQLRQRGDELSRRAAVFIERLEEARFAYEKERDWLESRERKA